MVRGQWKYLYRAVDKAGNTIDFLLRAQRDKPAARRIFEKAVDHNGEPDSVTIDGSPANLAALHDLNAERETPIAIRQVRITRPMLGFKTFRCASILLGGVELMQLITKGQMQCPGGAAASAAQHFYSLAT